MQTTDPCALNALSFICNTLKKQKSVSFNDVMGSSECKKFSVKEIGTALELLRRNGLVKASSRFGCSELLEFSATEVIGKGAELLKSMGFRN